MIDPATALAGVTAALTILEKVAKLAESVGDAKNKSAILEIQAKLGEAQGKIAQIMATLTEQVAENYRLQTELNKAKDELKAVQQKASARADAQNHNGVRWIRGRAEPYCAICFGKTDRDIPLVRFGEVQSCRPCGVSWSRPQPPPDFGIEQISYPEDRPHHIRDDESEFTRGR